MSGYELIPVMQALRADNKVEARQLLQPILEANPTADAWLLAARAQEDGQTDAIKGYLQRALALDPDHSESLQMVEQLGITLDTGAIDPVAQDVSTPATGASSPNANADQEDDPFGGINPFGGGASSTPEAEPSVDPDAEGVYEMLWDCKFCGTEKLLGKSQKFCPVCGATQDPSWRYFPSDEDKVAVHDHKFVGRDVTCDSCGTLNSGDSAYCTNCGAPLENATTARTFGVREKSEGARFGEEDLQSRLNAESAAYARGEIPTDKPKAVKPTTQKKSNGRNRWILPIIGVVLAGIAGVAYLLLATTQITATVTDRTWERTVQIEVLREERGSAECGSQPSDADVYDRRREQVDTRRVQTGETCRNVQVDQGDGTFRQQRQCDPVYENEAVMGDVCYYTVERWRNSREASLAGEFTQSLAWPATGITTSCANVGCEREGARSTDFVVYLQDAEGDVFTCDFSEAEWSEIPIGAEFTLEQRRFSDAELCNTLERVG